MHPISQFLLVGAVLVGVGIYAAKNVTCWHIPYVVTTCYPTK